MKPPRKLTIGIELIDDPGWIGGMLYSRHLAICLSRLPESERPKVRLIGTPNVVSRFLNELGHLAKFESAANNLQRRLLRRVGWPENIDVVYPGYGRHIPGAVTVGWMGDFQHRYLPHFFSAEEIAAREKSLAKIAGKPGVAVLSSEVEAEDFRRFYPNHQATPRVWHFCSLLDTTKPTSHSSLEKHGLPEKYLYLPNQFWAHKNHVTVLKALVRLRREHGMIIPLVCTGAQMDYRNKAHFSSLVQFVKEQGLTDQIQMLGLIDRSEQIDVLRHAAVVVQPSLYEGWSTVVEDVRATGRPIFLSDIPVHREQNPENCAYFDPESDEQLALLLASQWNGLRVGPDSAAEERAREELDDRILRSGREFCDIARMALDISKS